MNSRYGSPVSVVVLTVALALSAAQLPAAQENATLLISVVDSRGNAVPSPQVRFMPVENDDTHDWRRLTSDTRAYGTNLLCEDIQPGDYYVYVTADGYNWKKLLMTFKSGENKAWSPAVQLERQSPPPSDEPEPDPRRNTGTSDCLAEVERRFEQARGQVETSRRSIETSRSMVVMFNVAEPCRGAFRQCEEKAEADWYPCRNGCAPADSNCKSECSLQSLRDSLACHESALDCTVAAARAECGEDPGQPSAPPGGTCDEELRVRGEQYIGYNDAARPTPGFTAYTLDGSDACNATYAACENRVAADYNTCLLRTGKPGRCIPAERNGYADCANEQVRCVLREAGCR